MIMGSLIEPELHYDGTGRWVVHLDDDGRTVCGRDDIKIRTNSLQAVNCERCLGLVMMCDTTISHEKIDLLIGVYSLTNNIETYIINLLESLRRVCDLTGVNVFCIERTCCPISNTLRDIVRNLGSEVRSCEIIPYSDIREDTSQFSNWMVDNVGVAPWVAISHFDIVFQGDYIRYVREAMLTASMVGNHHDGIVFVNRDAYKKAGVGFCGVDNMSVIDREYELEIVPTDSPWLALHPRRRSSDSRRHVLQLDVGSLLALRMNSLGLQHVWITKNGMKNDFGKSDLFVHKRNGAGHA